MKRLVHRIISSWSVEFDSIFNVNGSYIYFFYISLIILGNVIDIISGIQNYMVDIVNIATILLALVIIILSLKKFITYSFGLGIATYITIINLILSHVIDTYPLNINPLHFLRSTLIFVALIPVAGMTMGRKHIIYVGLLYILFLFATSLFKSDPFIEKNIPMIIMVVIGYIAGIYTIIFQLEKSRKTQKILNQKLSKLNSELEAKSQNLAEYNSALLQNKEHIEIQAFELRQNMVTRDRFYSIISHDLKNPMGALAGFSDLLIRHIERYDDIKLIRYANMIKKTSAHANALLVNLLDWTRLQTGKININPEKFFVSELLDEMKQHFQVAAELKGINLVFIQPGNFQVFADKNMIGTVVRNLISNAVKFTPQEGSVQVEILGGVSNFVINVSDTGIGIPPDIMLNMFNLDAENITRIGTNAETGTGLGLLLCNEFIKMHHGKISIESEPSKGSVFSVQLPLNFKNSPHYVI